MCEEVLVITGPPQWASAEQPGFVERLCYMDEATTDGGPFWALVPAESDAEPNEPADEDCLPIDTALAKELIGGHLRSWLLAGAWQVQVTVRKGQPSWRLVDGLAFADGGGDRLDDDYPCGDDELTVLCESVLTLVRQPRRTRARGPG